MQPMARELLIYWMAEKFKSSPDTKLLCRPLQPCVALALAQGV